MELTESKETKKEVLRYEKNPFIDTLTIKTRGRKVTVARGSTLIDMSTGEIEGVTEIAQIVSVDDGQFVKLFTRDLAIWFDLSKSGMRVFGALLAIVQAQAIGRDMVFFDLKSEQAKPFEISKSAFFRGITELIEKGFVAKHLSLGWYFINPAMFFNGDRARFVKEYRRNETKQSDLFEPKIEAIENK